MKNFYATRFDTKRIFINVALAGCFALVLAACVSKPTSTPPQADALFLKKVGFDALPGWNDDHVADVIPALTNSCAALAQRPAGATPDIAGRAVDWAGPCTLLNTLPPNNDEIMRAFIENWFQPYMASGRSGNDGLFTGYYEAELHGSWRQEGQYQTPLYERPEDLITADLGAFRPEWKGKHIAGRVDQNRLVPYDIRTDIERGSLANRAHVLMWVNDPIDAYFLAIQGSGRVRMTDGSVVRVGYAAANGQPYTAIGKILADLGALQRPVSMQSIRQWLTEHPDRASTVMNTNASYVFFRILQTENPVGAQGVPLTPMRSMAVNSAFVPLGLPVWLDTVDGSGAPIQRLVIAQDTGGAIKGPVRGDYFWGFGPQAEAQAGAMQSRGHYYLLLPKTVTPDAK